MSLCPTGQCNATCDFCSVTILRTGIIKRQLPLDAIGRITSPAAQTVRMFGLEGNGEPTLYREFDRLVQLLLSNRAEAYLITNASQFDDDLLRVLLGFESINISLNAATAETHRRVMGLKNFDAIVAAIRKLMDLRGPGAQHPQVSVSFVVNRLNLHETLDFVRLAECDLGVDRIHVRPLSELANDGGTAEDFRDIVPFEGDIADVVEGMAEYLSDKATTRTAQIYFSGESFKAMRPNPLGSPVMPIDEPDRLLVPRRSGWQCLNRAVDAAWVQPAIVKLTRRSPGQGGVIFRSDPIPVPENGTYRLVFITSGETAGLAVRIVGTDGNELLSHSLQAVEPDEGPAKEYRVAFSPAGSRSACIEVLDDGAPFTAEIDFVRVRKPPPLILDNLPVPRPERWEVGVQGASVTWEGQLVRLLWSGAPGLYILKSYSQPCLPHTVVSYPAAVDVESGHLGIGVLSEDFSSWIAVSDYGPGRHHAAVRFETGTNERFQIVLYAVGEKGVAASIDWSRAMSEIPFWVPAAGKAVLPATATRPRQLTTMAIAAAEAGEVMRRAEVVQPRHPVPPSNEIDVLRPAVVEPATSGIERSPAPSSRARLGPKGGAAHAPAGPKERGSWLQRALVGKPRLYCHKPWTDLHNFTVDGRMDVCCIATGPSQERYQLGNLLTQDFQSVWNGPMAREFRRTVNNSAIALPPCRRCPMAYAYQGPYFDPVGTAWQVFRALRLYPLWRIPGFKTAHRMLFIALYGPVHIALFRGFRRPNPFPLSELKSWYKT
jgi:molybdenum cofactor biosynthesis enzyme MoaA